jgi:hypothetical protein
VRTATSKHTRTHHNRSRGGGGARRGHVRFGSDGVARVLRDEDVGGVRLLSRSVAAPQLILRRQRGGGGAAQRGVGAQVAQQQRKHRQQRALLRRGRRREAQVVRARQP